MKKTHKKTWHEVTRKNSINSVPFNSLYYVCAGGTAVTQPLQRHSDRQTAQEHKNIGIEGTNENTQQKCNKKNHT